MSKETEVLVEFDPSIPLHEREDIIVCEGVNKWYSNELHVLKDVDVSIKQGEIVCILGPSGSGKSTFIRTINALEKIQKGNITVDGTELSEDNAKSRRHSQGNRYGVSIL